MSFKLTAKMKADLRAAMLRAVRIVAAGLCALVGLGFLTAAGWQAAASHLSPIAASVLVGVIFITLAAGLVLLPRSAKRQRDPKIGPDDLLRVFLQAAETGRGLRH